MKLPEKLKIPLTIVGEASTEGVINQLIDYLKEREELQHTTCRPKEEKVHIPMEKVNYETQKIDSCACGGRGARGEHGSPKCSQYGNNDYVSPKKIDVEGLLDEYADLYFEHVVYGAKSERSQQIINQIKDAIK